MPRPSALELARIAYAAYGDSTDHRTHDDRPMPDWDALGDRVQKAWVAAAGTLVLETLAAAIGTTSGNAPSLGDVVLVPMDRDVNNGAVSAPAVVTRVWSPTTVNVRVLADSDAAPSWRTSVTFVETLDYVDSSAAVWTWPGGEV
jgi:hypothetical protein